jgi:hypothetical protein
MTVNNNCDKHCENCEKPRRLLKKGGYILVQRKNVLVNCIECGDEFGGVFVQELCPSCVQAKKNMRQCVICYAPFNPAEGDT